MDRALLDVYVCFKSPTWLSKHSDQHMLIYKFDIKRIPVRMIIQFTCIRSETMCGALTRSAGFPDDNLACCDLESV